MELKNLITFMKIVEEGSFGNAANILGYTQSTITFQMHQLEEELGVVLFERVGRRMILTQEGRDRIPYVQDVLLSLENLKNAGRQTKDLTGELRIVIAESLLCHKMQPVIIRFRELAPNIRVKIRTTSCYSARQALMEGTADLGVFYDMEEEDDALDVHTLAYTPMALVASPACKDTDFVTPNQKLNTALITDEPDCLFRVLFEHYVREKNITLGKPIELWSISTIKSMVESNLGVAYLPFFTVEKEIQNKTLKELPIEIDSSHLRAIYAYHKNKHINRQMELFLSLLRRIFE